MTEPDHYRILHVDPGAPEEIIRASYLTMMKRLKNHPDLGGEHKQAILINRAYTTLTDPRKRAEYDRRRQQQRPQPRDPEPSAPKKVIRRSETDPAPVQCCMFCQASVREMTGSQDSTCPECGSPLLPVERARFDASGERALERFPKRQEIAFCTSVEQRKPNTGQSMDISPLGMHFVTNYPLRPEQVIQIDCAVCRAVARVAYVSSSPDGYVVGVQFLSRQFKRNLGTFVSTRL